MAELPLRLLAALAFACAVTMPASAHPDLDYDHCNHLRYADKDLVGICVDAQVAVAFAASGEIGFSPNLQQSLRA